MVHFLAGIIGQLASSGLRLVANAALAKGEEFIKEKTGVDLKQASLSEDDLFKLRQFQAEHEEELLKIQLENNKLSLEETKAYLADVQDARANQTQVQTSVNAPWYVKAVQPFLAVLIVIITLGLFAYFVHMGGTLYGAQKEIVIYILGVLSAAITQILGYYFGSSKGSADKSQSLDSALLNSKQGSQQ